MYKKRNAKRKIRLVNMYVNYVNGNSENKYYFWTLLEFVMLV